MSILDPKIRKTTIKYAVLALIQIVVMIYLYFVIGNKPVSKEAKSGVAYTGLFVLVVFVIAFGMVVYQKTGENSKKLKKEKEKLAKYDFANIVKWLCLLLCFWAGGYFYAVREDISYFGICFACFALFIYYFPSTERFHKDF